MHYSIIKGRYVSSDKLCGCACSYKYQLCSEVDKYYPVDTAAPETDSGPRCKKRPAPMTNVTGFWNIKKPDTIEVHWQDVPQLVNPSPQEAENWA